MNEFELKFEVHSASLPRIKAALLRGKATKQRLRAHYVDTAEGDFAAHGISVRVRLEDKQWVQTAKSKTNRPTERLEHNVVLVDQSTKRVPIIDLALHAGTPVGKAIAKALNLNAKRRLNAKANETYPELVLIYATDVQRTAMLIENNDSAVEIALDQGRVFTDAQSTDLCELEFELKQGAPLAAVTLAQQWCADYGLWLNTITKSMKGEHLRSDFGANLAEIKSAKAVKTAKPAFHRTVSGAKMMSAVLQACLQEILNNASELASGSVNAEHVHHLRVGIRRMRTALRELDGLVDNIDPAWEIVLANVFNQLGQHRDHYQIETVLQPQLVAAGAPVIAFGASTNMPDMGAVIRAPAFQDVLLALIAATLETQASTHAAPPSTYKAMMKILRHRLKKLRSQALKDGKNFHSLTDAHQHRVRKRLKRLRYLSEFCAPFFATHKIQVFIDALKPAQDALGQYNDETLALQAYRSQALTDEKALFGVGWLSARRSPNAQQCLETILAFAKMRPFWDKP